MKKQPTIKKELRRLRKIAEKSQCPLQRRIASIMESTIRWAREDVRGWPNPSSEITFDANLITGAIREMEKRRKL